MKRPVMIVMFMLALPTVFGQGAKYIIRNYDLMDEINLNGSTWAMVQDTNGILYFGADYGIVTYTGSEWTLYSRGQSIVRSLCYDSRHRMIYGGFNDFGFLEADPTEGLVFRSLADPLPDSLKVFGDIWSISESNAKIYLQSRNRIFIIDGDSVSSLPVADTYHRSFTLAGKFALNRKGMGLAWYNGSSFIPWPGGDFFKDKVVSCAMESGPGRMLIGTRSEGVFQLDPASGSVKNAFQDFPETNQMLARDNMYHGLVLPDGTLAFATLFGGTYILDQEGRILKILNRSHGLRDNVNYFLGKGADNNLWICTSNGISAFNVSSPFIQWDYTSGIDGVVLDIEDFRDRICIGTLTGLYVLDKLQSGFKPLESGARKILNREVWNFAKIRRNGREMLFIGTGDGLYSMKDQEVVLERKGGIILKVMQLKSHPEILLALGADNIDIYRWQGMNYRHEQSVIGLYNGLRSAGEDEEGFLWIGTRHSGVVRIPAARLASVGSNGNDPAQTARLRQEIQTYPFDSLLTDVIEYQGTVIFTNYKGLFQYDESNGNFIRCRLFGPEIAGFSKMISSLNKDSRGNIWVGGEDIFLARPDGTYTAAKLNFQQLKDVFSAFVFLHGEDQRTWIGGNNGIYLFDSRVAMEYPSRIQTIISRIEIPGESTLVVNAGTLADREIPLEIDLAKRNSRVTFYYALPYFDNEERTLFSYKLTGYSNDWSEWTDETQVTFSNLKPASYSLRVRGKTIYNQIGQDAVIDFTVPGQWFYSRIAFAAYLVLFILLVYLISRYISKINVRKQLRIEDVIRSRIQESNRAGILNLLSAQHPVGGDPGVLIKPDGLPETESGRLSGDQAFLVRALKILELHMGNHDLTAGRFCREIGMSQARVYRKLIALTGMSINEFIRNIRLKKAAQLLIETDLPISEIAWQTGFSSPGYFTKCFTAEFGKNPRDFSQKRR